MSYGHQDNWNIPRKNPGNTTVKEVDWRGGGPYKDWEMGETEEKMTTEINELESFQLHKLELDNGKNILHPIKTF